MVLLMGVLMAALTASVAGIAGAQVAPASPTLNTTPDQTWMTNGIVYSIVRSGDYIYVGGKFTQVRSARTGGESFLVSNLARFDADTGVADRNWRPRVTGVDTSSTRVYALAATEHTNQDGTVERKIWVGGKFNAVDGVARRNLAAVTEGGVVDPDVDPLVGSETNQGVRALLASDSKVYLGGFFTSIDDKNRSRLGALDHSGNLDAWRPKVNNQVRSLAFSCDGESVFAGGKFREAAGPGEPYTPRETLARFDADSGTLNPWAIPAGSVPSDEVAADLAIACDQTTESQISAGFLGRNFVRSFDGISGAKVWENKCAGDVQTVEMLGSDKLIIGGHFSQINDAASPRGIKRTRIAKLNLADGLVDNDWAPAVDGRFLGPWDLLVDENHLYVGGAFTTVAGASQANFARFTFTP